MWRLPLLVLLALLSESGVAFRTPRTLRTLSRNVVVMSAERQKTSRKERRQIQFESMYAPAEKLEPPGPAEDHPAIDMVYDIVRAVDARKATNPVVYHVEGVTPSNSFMIVCCGNSRPQNQAIATNVCDEVEELHDRIPESKQGTAESGWILLDYGDVIVHVMTPKSRAFYDLEGFWKNGKRIDIEHLLLPNGDGQGQESTPSGSADGGVDFQQMGEDDPFWS
eukprot:CAMPEP_0118882192 /NCGR_PEP_ID=MMETSP1163-20130328/21492_1 /TAXON_ID=124430 /ORGANISM="Phaeomonas parva, Strain CCMP2877" /LENGTH=222 /DNA_ID=CAMNT_0006819169 /DNA_START=110 /DNA_END=778 /DNA_ORIENTATION=+